MYMYITVLKQSSLIVTSSSHYTITFFIIGHVKIRISCQQRAVLYVSVPPPVRQLCVAQSPYLMNTSRLTTIYVHVYNIIHVGSHSGDTLDYQIGGVVDLRKLLVCKQHSHLHVCHVMIIMQHECSLYEASSTSLPAALY